MSPKVQTRPHLYDSDVCKSHSSLEMNIAVEHVEGAKTKPFHLNSGFVEKRDNKLGVREVGMAMAIWHHHCELLLE